MGDVCGGLHGGEGAKEAVGGWRGFGRDGRGAVGVVAAEESGWDGLLYQHGDLIVFVAPIHLVPPSLPILWSDCKRGPASFTAVLVLLPNSVQPITVHSRCGSVGMGSRPILACTGLEEA